MRADKQVLFSSHQDNTIDHTLSFGAGGRLSEKLDVDLSAGYYRLHDGRGTTFTGVNYSGTVPDKYREYDLRTTLGYGHNNRVETYVEYGNKRYYNNRYVITPLKIYPQTVTRDVDTIGGGIGFSVQVMPKTSMVLETRYKHFDYKYLSPSFNLDSYEQRYFAGVNWDATAKTSGRLRLGYTTKRFNDKRNADYAGLGGELGATWNPKVYSTFDLSFRYELRIPVKSAPDSSRTRHPIPVKSTPPLGACC